ncbi:Protein OVEREXPRESSOR OF CATIONIC PEROXIDASE 3 [Carex littledalei]|uniref:Protein OVEREXPRESSOR OF CATIONIC PEROXIDASE 3 n=1 Tax=Carex littledalei TaxID=544730 RepID=A0A833VMX8_9POAL|nr:Protein OVEREXPRESSOR OF CATIONIC PEROXIDASE 3 [Carex littledalei]
MAACTCSPSTLLGRVYPIQLDSHGGNTSYSPLRLGPAIPSFVPLSSSPPRSSVIAFWRRRKKRESHLATESPTPKKKTALDDFMGEEEEEEEEEFNEEGEEEDEEEAVEDALEAFFSQLEKDFNNHNPSEDDVEIKDEDVVRFQKEISQALGESGVELDEDGLNILGLGEEEDVIQLPQLRTWQMRKLAHVLKIGKRKASIKKLSEDVGLDRATVLEYLRNPPPSLLLMSDSLPDEPSPQAPTELESSEMGSSISTDAAEVKSKETEPEVKQQPRQKRHPVQQPYQKRLKRVQVETLQRVYSRTKRPTDEVISSIVHVTNLPRKVVVNWFEEKRNGDGIPHKPIIPARYQRQSVTRTVSR